MPGQLPDGAVVDGVVVDGVVVVVDGVVVVDVVDGVVEDELDAAFAIAAPPPPMTPATPSVASMILVRFIGLHLLRSWVTGISEPPRRESAVCACCESDTDEFGCPLPGSGL